MLNFYLGILAKQKHLVMNNLSTILTLFLLFLLVRLNINAQQKGTISDYDGNIYQTIIIGNQEWMTENLKTTHYADGTALVDGTYVDDITGDYSTKYYFWFNDDSATAAGIFGALYTWAAAMNDETSSYQNPSGVQGVCPDNWHLPSDDEWKELEMFLGMSQSEAEGTDWRGTNEGSKLAGNASLWVQDVLENNAEFGTSGFIAIPAGFRGISGTFYDLFINSDFWSATEANSSEAWNRELFYTETQVGRNKRSKAYGFEIRCIKNAGTSVNDLEKNNEINFYPNPSKGSIHINLANHKETNIFIYSIDGRLIHTELIRQNKTRLNISYFEKGIYLIQIQNNDYIKTKKLVIE